MACPVRRHRSCGPSFSSPRPSLRHHSEESRSTRPTSPSFGGTEKHLALAEVADAEAWYLTDNGGTTAALFVISNSIKNARQRGAEIAKFLVSPRPLPICAADDLDDPPDASKPAQVFITLSEPDTPVRCAVGFRIGLEIDAFHAIQAVRLAVRSP